MHIKIFSLEKNQYSSQNENNKYELYVLDLY